MNIVLTTPRNLVPLAKLDPKFRTKSKHMRLCLPWLLRIAGLELELADKLRYEFINLDHSDALSDANSGTHSELVVVVRSTRETTRIAKQMSQRMKSVQLTVVSSLAISLMRFSSCVDFAIH